MDAIELMMSEHRLIERVLDCLESLAERVAAGDDVEPSRLADHVRFLRGYADAIHHGKEEHLLFAALRAQGCPELEPVVEAVCREHETGRNLVDDLEAGARGPLPWTEPRRERVRRAASSFVSMLRKHIADEDEYVFPQVRRRLAADTWRRVQQAAERFEAANAERRRELEGLAERLTAASRARTPAASERRHGFEARR